MHQHDQLLNCVEYFAQFPNIISVWPLDGAKSTEFGMEVTQCQLSSDVNLKQVW